MREGWRLRCRMGALAAATAFGLALVGGGCSSKKAPGALMLAFSTDLAVPKDVSAVGLYITASGRPIHFGEYEAVDEGTGQYFVRFPSTFAVVSNGSASGSVRVQLVAFKKSPSGRVPFVMREALTTVPTDRTALLRMPLQWLNQGGIVGTTPTPGSLLRNNCAAENLGYVDGECGNIEIDSSKLPDYREGDVFGGGSSTGKGSSCFDVAQCFGQRGVVTVDPRDCTIPGAPSDVSHVNLALQTKGGEGVCIGDGATPPCFAVLDASVPGDPASTGSGWSARDGRIYLPRGVCRRLRDGDATALVASGACASKAESVPLCGPWSVPADTRVTPAADAGPPPFVGDGGGDAGPAVVENVGPGEPSIGRIALLADRVYIAAANGKVTSVRKDDIDGRLGTIQVLRASGGPDFGYTLAAGNLAGRDYVALGFTGSNLAGPFNGGSLIFDPSAKTIAFAPNTATPLPPYTAAASAVVFAPGFGFYFQARTAGNGGPEQNQLMRLTAPDLGTTNIAGSPFGPDLQGPPGTALAASASGDVYFGGNQGGELLYLRCRANAAECLSPGGFNPLDVSMRFGSSPAAEATDATVGAMTVGNDGYVYFTLVGRTAVPSVSGVFRLPTTGTNTTVREVFSEPLLPLTTVANSPVVNDIANDDNWVYVTTESEVRVIAKRGTQTGVSRVLVANQPRPRGIAVDATHVYWSTLGAGTTVTAGNVRRIAKPPAP